MTIIEINILRFYVECGILGVLITIARRLK